VAKREGIIPALESAHAVAHALKIAGDMQEDEILIVNLSGRGDKDLDTVRSKLTSEDTEEAGEATRNVK
jgi:tryptophan synthase beta chain